MNRKIIRTNRSFSLLKSIGQLLLIISLQLPSIAQNDLFDKQYDTTKNVLILVHPTAYGIKNIMWLHEHELFKPEHTVLMGVYYENERYDYAKSLAYIKAHDIENYHLQKLSGELSDTNLFEINDLSDDFENLFSLSTGIIFFGGPDIQPVVYGEKTNLLTSVDDPDRHRFELSLLFHLLGGNQDQFFKPLLANNPEYLVWAFCLGMQTMNVATGGTLVQDIPTEIYALNHAEDVLKLHPDNQHKNYHNVLTYNPALTGGHLHSIVLFENTVFTTQMGYQKDQHPKVYSYHHQCIQDLGKGLETIATSMDGKVIEAVRHTDYKNVIGYQFHPEKYALYDPDVKYAFVHNDTSKTSFYDLLNDGISLEFNKAIWNYFNKSYHSIAD